MIYRLLKQEEIDVLLKQGCKADEWADITVADGFSAGNIINTRFDGKIRLGKMSGSIELEKGIPVKCGIYNSFISNCEIGNAVYISEVKNLSNYIVEDQVAIVNVGNLVVSGVTSFGNGTEIEVLNEGGGRELPVYDRLTSQIAYLTVLYRHDKDFTEKMLGLIGDYCNSRRSDKGRIQTGARIRDSLIIRNVAVGSHARITGASLLEEGTIQSCPEAPAMIGEGVIAKKFIVLSGSKVDGGAMIDKSFVGQGVKMGKQFSAENSLFFANCEAFHGEACSLFAGPYTVTHHKSTLMIASMFSFFNAGSGTNQSNHMYKLGPVHQGILERGSKTGSFAYLLLPAFVGAYTVVMGKHYANFNTRDFPFSYISEEKGKSELVPAMNIFTVGTRRDSEKWPTRDRRTDPEKLDLIHFDLFNPYIVGRIVNGINILNDLSEKTDKKQDFVTYNGIHIHRLLFKTSRKYYELGLKTYIGQEVVKRIAGLNLDSAETVRNRLKPGGREGEGQWLEICGMFSPSGKIEELMQAVKSGAIRTIEDLNQKLVLIHKNYDKYAWVWCSNLIGKLTGSDPDQISIANVINIVSDWKTDAIKLNNMILKDAEKEFDTGSKLGFGIDGDEDARDKDFQAVRGAYDENKFVLGLLKESKEIEEKADRLLADLGKL